MRAMSSTRGHLLIAAAVLAGAALAQSAWPFTPWAAAPAEEVRTTANPHSTPLTPHRTATAGKQAEGAGQGIVIYLTFDDGPQPDWTPRVLDVLERHDARATFFMLGQQASQYPALVTQVRQRGHTIGNHTAGHLHLPRLTTARVREEIMGGPESLCFRPPFRETDARIHEIATSLGLREVLWDIDTFDWRKPGAAEIERALLKGIHPGAIVLMHDGGGDRSQTVQALDRVLTKLTAKGYTFRALRC
jgi:peptidoglycan/xylan/chitin deacetylase (PgdA/CDA1 family)